MFRVLAELVYRWLGSRKAAPDDRKPPPDDPYSPVRQPVRRGPPSLAAGVALEEPAPQTRLNLFGPALKKSSR
jgi:hypothetical protein